MFSHCHLTLSLSLCQPPLPCYNPPCSILDLRAIHMPIIVDGKRIAEEKLQSLKKRVDQCKAKGREPALAVILVGDDPASRTYVKNKQEAAARIGVAFFRFEYPADTPKDKLLEELRQIQGDARLTGLIVQLPLPPALDSARHEIVNAIAPALDVDCLTDRAQGELVTGASKIFPPTPAAIMEILARHAIDLKGVHIVLVGRGDLVGKPLAAMLMHEPVTLTVCSRATKNLAEMTRQADVLITGAGKLGLITGDMVKEGAVVVDASTVLKNGKLAGDVDFETVAPRAALITPVPGGVGPLTVAKLLENTLINAEIMIARMCHE